MVIDIFGSLPVGAPNVQQIIGLAATVDNKTTQQTTAVSLSAESVGVGSHEPVADTSRAQVHQHVVNGEIPTRHTTELQR